MSTPFVDIFFNKKSLEYLGEQIAKSCNSFDTKLFLSQVYNTEWEQTRNQIKWKGQHVTKVINDILNKPYPEALDILLHVNKRLSFKYTYIIFPEFVALYGLEHFHTSMIALKEFTRNSTSEFAIRHFLLKYEQESMEYMNRWSRDENLFVRRLSSEGCRPLLPLGYRIPSFVNDPTPILPILEQLKQDPELYVQKSVANSLNDISKHHPQLVLKMCSNWNQINNSGTQFIIKRACRTILKKGDQEALQFFGVGAKESVKVTNLKVHESEIRIGNHFTFSFDIEDISHTHSSQIEIDNATSTISPIQILQGETLEQLDQQKEEELVEEGELVEDEVEQEEIGEILSNDNKFKINDKLIQKNKNEVIVDKNGEGIRIEYKVYYLKSNGTHSPKVFMLRNQFLLPKKRTVLLQRKQRVQQLTTRKHYTGLHYISIVVNGIEKAKTQFTLLNEQSS